MNKKTAVYLATHVLAVAVAVGTAITAVGPGKLAGLFSHDPTQILISAGALLVALGTSLGAAMNGNLFSTTQK